MTATAHPLNRTSVDWILARTSPTPPALRWPWDDEHIPNEGDEDVECDAPRCGCPLDHRETFYAYQDVARACSRRCAAEIEARAEVRHRRRLALRRTANTVQAAQARAMEDVARACRYSTGRASLSDVIALLYVPGSDRIEIAKRYARLAQIDRNLALYGRSPKPPAAEVA